MMYEMLYFIHNNLIINKKIKNVQKGFNNFLKDAWRIKILFIFWCWLKNDHYFPALTFDNKTFQDRRNKILINIENSRHDRSYC